MNRSASNEQRADISQYCRKVEIIDMRLPRYPSIDSFTAGTTNMIRQLLRSGPTFSLSPFYSVEFARKLKQMSLSDYDVILTDGQMAFYVEDMPIPRVVVPFDARSENLLLMARNSTKVNKRLMWTLLHLREKLYEDSVYGRFDASIVVTSRDKELLSQRVESSKIHVIPNGVDTEFFKPLEIPRHEESIVFIGSMDQQPNIDAVIRFYISILPTIKRERPDTRFIVVGSNPSREIMKLRDDPSIEVTGFVEDIRPYLTRSAVVVAPMFYGVGIKNKVLEAMAMGKPIVSSLNGIEGIDVKNGKHLLATNDNEEFAYYVISLLNDVDMRESFGIAARHLVESRYSWNSIAEKYDQVISTITR